MPGIYYNTNREWENYIQEIRIDRGLSFKELGERSNVKQSQLYQLASGRTSPIYQRFKKGEIKPWVLRVCTVLNVKPEMMFPREICPLEDPKIKGFHQTQIDEITLSSYCQRSINLKPNNLRRFIWSYITKIFWFKEPNKCHPKTYKRMVKVIHLRFLCEMTLDEVSLKMGVTRERVRQLEAKMLRFMRYPSFSKGILECVEGIIKKD